MNISPEEGRRTYRPKRRILTTNKEVVSPKNSSIINNPPQDYRENFNSIYLIKCDISLSIPKQENGILGLVI